MNYYKDEMGPAQCMACDEGYDTAGEEGSTQCCEDELHFNMKELRDSNDE